jgi:uncharacterized protein DUF6448
MLFAATGVAFAHCDTLDGPVVVDAKVALKKGEPTVVLKWVKKEHENEIKEAFTRTLVVRTKGEAAKKMADMYFFEILVRIHREGEGAPYTGVKPAGSITHPAVIAADKAIEMGSVENLARKISGKVAEGIQEQFNNLAEKKKYMNDSVEAGREYVEAYVNYVHYVEGIHDALGRKHHHAKEEQHEQ